MRKSIYLLSAAMLGMMASCVDKEPNGGGGEMPGINEIPGFSTVNEVTLDIDYGYDGYSPNFGIYIENPYNEDGTKKDGVEPYFGSFTDENSSYKASISLPAYVKTVYLCSSSVGVPRCLELNVENGAIAYKFELPELPGTTLGTRAGYNDDPCYVVAKPTTVDGRNKLYGLYNNIKQNNRVDGVRVSYWAYNDGVDDLYSVDMSRETSALLRRTQAMLTDRRGNKKDNSQYTSDSEDTNITIPTTFEGKELEGCHLDLVFIDATGEYENAMGYYYYKTGTTPDISSLPKYVVFPLTTDGKPNHPVKARLQFYGENYDEAGTDDFPGGYTIGWVLFPNIDRTAGGWFVNYDSWKIADINDGIAEVYSDGMAIYSNSEYNRNMKKGCITLNDTETGRVVIGFEDQTNNPKGSDNSFDDILFYVESNPDVIYNEDRPDIPEEPEEPSYDTYTTCATLAFEDIWPTGGDYDLNDVIVEQTRTVTYNSNGYITEIKDAFKVTNLNGSADYVDAFGFTVASNAVGDASGAVAVEEDNQFIMLADAQAAIGNTCELVRTFEDGELANEGFDDEFNPFIVVNYVAGKKNRTEVHLPKHAATSWANMEQQGTADDAYYVNKNGKYPFAISLEGVTGWVPVTEEVTIGSVGEYPQYNNWVEAGCPTSGQYADWYLSK